MFGKVNYFENENQREKWRIAFKTNISTETNLSKEVQWHYDKQTDKQIDKQTNKQTNKQTDSDTRWGNDCEMKTQLPRTKRSYKVPWTKYTEWPQQSEIKFSLSQDAKTKLAHNFEFCLPDMFVGENRTPK